MGLVFTKCFPRISITLKVNEYNKGRQIFDNLHAKRSTCRRRGSRENGDRVSITEAAKSRSFNEGVPRTCYPGKKFFKLPFPVLSSFSDRISARFQN